MMAQTSHFFFRQGALLLSVFALTHCGSSTLTRSSLKIIGGHPVKEGQYVNTAAIMQLGNPICSGTLITPTYVLTAGHCVEKYARGTSDTNDEAHIDDLKIAFALNVRDIDPSRVMAVKSVALHPGFWTDHLSSLDFALIELKEPAPIKPAPLMTRRVAINSLVDHAWPLSIVGFGLTDSHLDPAVAAGIKFEAQAALRGRKGDEIFLGSERSDTCSGDSGGPAYFMPKTDFNFVDRSEERFDLGFANSDPIVVAVTSRGPFPCAQKYEPGVSTMIPAGICWIQKITKSQNSYWKEDCAREDAGFVPSRDFLESINANVKNIELPGKNIREVSWIKNAVHLEKIIIPWNRITDLSPLLELENLHYVDIRGNDLQDLSQIEALTQRGVTVLGGFTQKSQLKRTKFAAYAGQGLKAGVSIRATVLALKSILTQGSTERRSADLATRVFLGLQNRDVRSLKPLENLENVEVINLADNQKLESLESLLTLPKLQTLNLTRSKIKETELQVLKTLQDRSIHVITAD
jgi:Leucine-rich repeat (LRR) protein